MTIKNIVSFNGGIFNEDEYLPTPEEALDILGQKIRNYVKRILGEGLASGSIRMTPDTEISIFDFLLEVCEKKNPRDAWKQLTKRYSELVDVIDYFQFPGQGQRPTPVGKMDVLLRILTVVPGEQGAFFRELQNKTVMANAARVEIDSQKEVMDFDELANQLFQAVNLIGKYSVQLEKANAEIEYRNQQDKKVHTVYPLVERVREVVGNANLLPPASPEEALQRWATIAEWLVMFQPDVPTCKTFRNQLGKRVRPMHTGLAGTIPPNKGKGKLYHISQWEAIAIQYEMMTEIEGINPRNYVKSKR